MFPFFDGSHVPRPFVDMTRQKVMINLHGEGEEFVADVPFTASFGQIKNHVGQHLGVEPDLIQLNFKGRNKDDNDILLHSGVKQGSRIAFRVKPQARPAAQQPISRGQAYAESAAAFGEAPVPTASPQHHKGSSSHRHEPYRNPKHQQSHTSGRERHSSRPATEAQDNAIPGGWTTFSPPPQQRPAYPAGSPNTAVAAEPRQAGNTGEGASPQSPETVASLQAIQKVAKDVDALTSQVRADLDARAAAMLKEQLTQKLLVLDSIDVTSESRPVRKALIIRIDKSCDDLQRIESRFQP